MKSLVLVCLCFAAANAGFDFGNFVNGLASGPLAPFKSDIDAVEQLVAQIKDHKSPQDIIKAVVNLNLQDKLAGLCKISFLQSVGPVQQACNAVVPLLGQAANLAQAGAGLLGQRTKRGFNVGNFVNGLVSSGPLSQFKGDVDAVEQLVSQIKDHHSPQDILQAVVNLNLQDKLASLCKISFLQSVGPVQKACNTVVPLLGQAQNLAQAAPSFLGRKKRGFNFGNFVNGLVSSGPLSQFKTEIDAFKNLADVIKQHKSPQDIVQAVVNLNLQDRIADLCKISFLQTLEPVQKACAVVPGLLGQAENLAQAAPAFLG